MSNRIIVFITALVVIILITNSKKYNEEFVAAVKSTGYITALVAERYAATVEFAVDADDLGELSSYTKLDNATGVITVRSEHTGELADSDYVQLTPEYNGNMMIWHCETNVSASWLPRSCQQ